MGIIITILLGAFVGWLASVIMKRDAEQGWLGNIVVGIVGAFVGNGIAYMLGAGKQAYLAFDLSGLLWSLGGAMVLLWVVNLIQGRNRGL